MSLALCLATVALWVRGRVSWNYDQVGFNGRTGDDGRQTLLRAANTPFGIDVGLRWSAWRHAPGWHYRSSRSTLTDSDSVDEAFVNRGASGIAGIWRLADATPTWEHHDRFFPHWLAAALTAALPLLWLVAKSRGWRRHRSGLVPRLLRATPDRCPPAVRSTSSRGNRRIITS